jgi:hypothetical protein
MEDLPVCPKMRCNSFCPFPETGIILPCAKHGTLLVPYSEAPLRKHIYRYLEQKIFKIKYATHKVRRDHEH